MQSVAGGQWRLRSNMENTSGLKPYGNHQQTIFVGNGQYLFKKKSCTLPLANCTMILTNEADRKLFKAVSQCLPHVLCHLLVEKPTSGRSLRPTTHNFIFPPKDNRIFVATEVSILKEDLID